MTYRSDTSEGDASAPVAPMPARPQGSNARGSRPGRHGPSRLATHSSDADDVERRDEAATHISRVARGHLARRRTKSMKRMNPHDGISQSTDSPAASPKGAEEERNPGDALLRAKAALEVDDDLFDLFLPGPSPTKQGNGDAEGTDEAVKRQQWLWFRAKYKAERERRKRKKREKEARLAEEMASQVSGSSHKNPSAAVGNARGRGAGIAARAGRGGRTGGNWGTLRRNVRLRGTVNYMGKKAKARKMRRMGSRKSIYSRRSSVSSVRTDRTSGSGGSRMSRMSRASRMSRNTRISRTSKASAGRRAVGGANGRQPAAPRSRMPKRSVSNPGTSSTGSLLGGRGRGGKGWAAMRRAVAVGGAVKRPAGRAKRVSAGRGRGRGTPSSSRDSSPAITPRGGRGQGRGAGARRPRLPKRTVSQGAAAEPKVRSAALSRWKRASRAAVGGKAPGGAGARKRRGQMPKFRQQLATVLSQRSLKLGGSDTPKAGKAADKAAEKARPEAAAAPESADNGAAAELAAQ